MTETKFFNIDGAWYETTETKDATGLISNGRFIEGQFSWGDFHSSNATSSTWKQLGAVPARPLEIPPGDYDLSEFTAEEWARLVPGCVVEYGGASRLVVIPVDSSDKCIVQSGLGVRTDWSRSGVCPADNVTAYIVGRRPVAKEPVTEVVSVEHVTVKVPAEWAGKTVEIRLLEETK